MEISLSCIKNSDIIFIHENEIFLHENRDFDVGMIFSALKCSWVVGLYKTICMALSPINLFLGKKSIFMHEHFIFMHGKYLIVLMVIIEIEDDRCAEVIV